MIRNSNTKVNNDSDTNTKAISWIPWVIIVRVALILVGLYVLFPFCQYLNTCSSAFAPSEDCVYVAAGLFLGLFVWHQVLQHTDLVEKARQLDPAWTSYLITQAEQLVSNTDDHKQEVNERDGEAGEDSNAKAWEALRQEIEKEIENVKRLKPYERNEYALLQLQELIVPSWDVLDLIESARGYLAELEEYARDSKFRYEWEQFTERRTRIQAEIEHLQRKIEQGVSIECIAKTDVAHVRNLRSMILGLLEHIAEYRRSWGVGSAIIRALSTYECSAAAVLLFMGILPIVYPTGTGNITVLNWGFLGAAGALTAALQALRQEQAVEVGYSEGKQEIRKAMLGLVLGLIAGATVYALIAGELLSGDLFPELRSESANSVSNIGKSIFWALAAGYSFEAVFDHMRSASSQLTS